jgi:uncharacterized membrane protein/mono/diheme cytochrome c family protein
MKHDLLMLLGRFHPLLVHLPIGGLALLALLELRAALTRRMEAVPGSGLIAGFVSVAAAAAAAAGWLLARDGAYDAQLLKWHRALGVTLALGCLLTFLLRQWGRVRTYRASLAASALLLVVVGHLGGSISYGRDFLPHYARKLLPECLGCRAQKREIVAAQPPTQQPVFEAVIAPILAARCSACHGDERHKAGLRLDDFDGWLGGGADGPVIKPGHAEESLLVQRLRLPPNADGHMPPEDQPQLTAAEIALLEWWINAGAPRNTRIGELARQPEIKRFLEVVSARPAPRN